MLQCALPLPGNEHPDDVARRYGLNLARTDDYCNKVCNGNTAEMCGAYMTYSVYEAMTSEEVACARAADGSVTCAEPRYLQCRPDCTGVPLPQVLPGAGLSLQPDAQ